MTTRTLWNRRIAMRDGVTVAADVVLPAGDGPWPAVVNRTPYLRGGRLRPDTWLRLVDRGYAFVAVDMRGRGDSDGEFTPFVHDADDGHDTIEWVAAQSWCTGRVGTVGGSYEGLTQWWAAKGRPPHLRCVVPQCVGAASLGPRWSSDTGVPVSYWAWWFNLVSGRTYQNPAAPSWERTVGYRPLRLLGERVGAARQWWSQYVAGEIDWLGPDFVLTAEDWARFDVPALIGVGWWDDQATMATWLAVRDSPAGPASRLIIGAWDHAGNMLPRPVLGGLDVSASVIDVLDHIERFLARHLKDDPGAEPARCRVFRTGAMRWEELDDWPAPNTVPTSWYLDAGGRLADTAGPDGADGYDYDPADPVRDFSSLDALAWSDPPLDIRYLTRRPDTLTFTTDALTRPVDVSGRASFAATVSVDAVDTDLCAFVYDRYPDGRSIFLGGLEPAMLRLSWRGGAEPQPMVPGVPVDVRVPLSWLHHRFLPGHRIGLLVTSSWSPLLAPNPNTGAPWADAERVRPARVTIHRGVAHRSRLVLPVEPGGAR